MVEKFVETNLMLDGVNTEPLVKTSDPYVGKVFDGKYQIEAKLGYGGMAVVYRAKHIFMERIVAIKLLHGENIDDNAYIERFKYEARAAGRIQHPNAVVMSDFGVSNEKIFYLVMEYLEGYTLRTKLKNEEPLETKSVIEIISQTASAIEFAHKCSVIHRDLKPDNIFLQVKDGIEIVKVLDFGIAKILQSGVGNTRLTATGAIIGTPQYMSPEQCQGDTIDPLTDIYSLGIIAYELLTGKLPFTGETPFSIALKQLNEPPPNIKLSRPDLPDSVDQIIKKALAKNRKNRHSSALVFAEELCYALSNSTGKSLEAKPQNRVNDKDLLPTLEPEPNTNLKCSNSSCKDPKPTSLNYCQSCKCLLSGLILRERYEIKELISRSSTNFTYLIKDKDCFDQFLLLKEVRQKLPKLQEDEALYKLAKESFERGARTLLSLKHSGIPSYYAYFAEGSNSYLVQQHLVGITLAEKVKNSAYLSSEELYQILVEIADILDYLHSQNPPIIHCGIKPQNLAYVSDKLMLIDFSDFCKALSDKSKSSQLANSRGYMAPEQLFGRPVPQSDLFSAGATIIYLMTGVHPNLLYDGDSQILEKELAIEINPSFLELLKDLLVQDVTKRLSSAKELKQRLSQITVVDSTDASKLTISKILKIFKGSSASNIKEEIIKESNIAKAITINQNFADSKLKVASNKETSEIQALTSSQFAPTKLPDETGDVSQTHVAFLLAKFLVNNRSGLLTCVNDLGIRTIQIENGKIVFASSTLVNDRLGEVLVRIGRINSSDFERALSVMQLKNIPFGEALVEIGAIRPEHIKTLLTIQVSNIIYSLFEWSKGKYEIRYDLRLSEPFKLSLPIAKVIFDGLYYLNDFNLVKNWFTDYTRKFTVTSNLGLLEYLNSLSKAEKVIVSSIKSFVSINDLLSLNLLPQVELLGSIYGLFALNILEWSKDEVTLEPKIETDKNTNNFDLQKIALFCHDVENQLQVTEKLNFYGILGLEQNATQKEIEEAYNKLSNEFSPDNHTSVVSYNENLKKNLETLFSRISKAYFALSNSSSRSNYDLTLKSDKHKTNLDSYSSNSQARLSESVESKQKISTSTNSSVLLKSTSPSTSLVLSLPPQVWFKKGVEHYQQGQFQQATKAFQMALTNDLHEIEYQIFLARSLMAQGFLKEAELIFQKVIELSPKRIDCLTELALLYQKTKQFSQAKELFNKILKLSPNSLIVKASRLVS